MTFSRFSSPFLRIALCSIGLVLLGAPRTVDAQTPELVEVCGCGNAGVCQDDEIDPYQDIENLMPPKPHDLVLCASDWAVGACEVYFGKPLAQRVSTVQEAKEKIVAKNIELGRKLNVVVVGHGNSGFQCFGPRVWPAGAQDCGEYPVCNGDCPDGQVCFAKDTTGNGFPDDCKCAVRQCIGNSSTMKPNKDNFVGGDLPPAKEGAKGKIKSLFLVGCSVAAGDPGQNFVNKLRAALEADSVKAWEDINQAHFYANWKVPETACGADPATCEANGTCGNGEVCRAKDTNGDNIADACRCIVVSTDPLRKPKYRRKGRKKKVGNKTAGCDGTESGGTGENTCDAVPRDYAYAITDPQADLTDFYVGTHDAGMMNYSNWCMPPGWTVTIEPNTIKLEHGSVKTPHGQDPPREEEFCPTVIHFAGPAGLPAGEWRFGFDNPQPSHDVGWELFDATAITRANWAAPVGHGEGSVHGPSLDIPAVSEWGLVVMALLVAAAGTVVIRRMRTVPACQ